jgi:hypothetical protein
MVALQKTLAAIGALACIILGSITNASAISADVAKRCTAVTAQTFPQHETGNPASRSGEVNGLSQHRYFQKCVSNRENEDDTTPQGEK